MSIIAWVLLGLVAGFIASKVVNHSGEGVILDIVLGVVGAVEVRRAVHGRFEQRVDGRVVDGPVLAAVDLHEHVVLRGAV